MRLEVTVPDDSPEALILSSVSDPQAYVLGLVRADRDVRARTQDTPDLLAILSQADASPNRFKTREEIDAHIAGLRAEWER